MHRSPSDVTRNRVVPPPSNLNDSVDDVMRLQQATEVVIVITTILCLFKFLRTRTSRPAERKGGRWKSTPGALRPLNEGAICATPTRLQSPPPPPDDDADPSEMEETRREVTLAETSATVVSLVVQFLSSSAVAVLMKPAPSKIEAGAGRLTLSSVSLTALRQWFALEVVSPRAVVVQIWV
uniref:Uncharacterized protein n=1 Tax=Panagrellus redivivus TaxID=6233 RepID=A0A7E4ULY5_PANRE